MTTTVDTDTARQFAMFNAGREWASALAAGDIFRGSYGEAVHRGLTDWDAKFFSAGAQTVITDMTIYVTGDDSNTIFSVNRR